MHSQMGCLMVEASSAGVHTTPAAQHSIGTSRRGSENIDSRINLVLRRQGGLCLTRDITAG